MHKRMRGQTQAIVGAAFMAAQAVSAADWRHPESVAWQVSGVYETAKNKAGKDEPHRVAAWLPPACALLRGLFISQTLGIEEELQLDPEVRKACAESGIAIVRFEGLSGTFKFWAAGNRDGERLLNGLDLLARTSGHPEIRCVPWITAGHSTDGIFCRNVAYWKPDRVAAVVHIKSGNFHQKNCLPPTGSLAGIPLLAINGQLETYGPETGIDKEWGRETQWMGVRGDIWKFRAADANHLMSMLVQPGDDHFNGAPEIGRHVAMFLRKTSQYRLPPETVAGADPIAPLSVKLEDGWLTDADLHNPRFPTAAYTNYTGDKAKAMWHFDRELAEDTDRFHRNMGKHQVISNPVGAWLAQDDGWVFKAAAEWLTVGPEKFGGKIGSQVLGHSPTPFVFRCRQTDPVRQIGPDTFQVLRLPRGKNAGFSICAYHPGDDNFRATYRWGGISVPQVKGPPQTIAFPPVGDLKWNAKDVPLKAKATSGLPIYYEVDDGPVTVQNGLLSVSDLPTNPQYPFVCHVTAYQKGRRSKDPVPPAEPVTVTFNVIAF